MASEDILQSLQNAARSRESAAMCSALALLDAACMEDAQECAIVLHFLSSFAHVAELANWNAEKLLAALRHVGQRSMFDHGQRAQLLDIHRTLLRRLLDAGQKETAVALASIATHCGALSEADHAIVLAILLESGHLDRHTVPLVERFNSKGPQMSLLRALERGNGDLMVATMGDAEALRSVAAWAVGCAPENPWVRKALAAALVRIGQFDQALESVVDLPADGDVQLLRAWALFGKKRFTEARACLHSHHTYSGLALVLKAVISEVEVFEASAPPAQWQSAVSEEVLSEIAGAQDVIALLGPAALFSAGGRLAQAGVVQDAVEFCRSASDLAPTPRYCYGAIHLMQLVGLWDVASLALDNAPRNSSALACLRLQQTKHDGGHVGLSDLTDLVEQDPQLLLRGKWAVLAGENCSYLDLSAAPSREVAEETLRINLALSVRAGDLAYLSECFDETLFGLMPAPEREFYMGAYAWLNGDTSAATLKLTRALDLAPECLPAIRCLAAINAEQGNYRVAGSLWNRATKVAPTDGTAFVQRAVQFAAAGDIAKGVASLRNYSTRERQNRTALYCLARLELSAALQQAASIGDHDSKASGGAMRRAAVLLERLPEIPEAKWYLWVCRVIETPARLWADHANALVTAEPDNEGAGAPWEAEWLRGQLRVLCGNFEATIEGMHILTKLAQRNLDDASVGELTILCWRAVLQARTAQQASRLVMCIEPMIGHLDVAWVLLDFLVGRFGVRPWGDSKVWHQSGVTRPVAKLANIRWALAAGDQQMLDSFLEYLQTDPDSDEKRRLLAGIVALELRAHGVFRSLSADAQRDAQWETLRAVALAQEGHKDAVPALCGLLENAATGSTPWPAILPLAGVFSYLGSKARKYMRSRILHALSSLPSDLTIADDETALSFLRISTLVGDAQRAIDLVEGSPWKTNPTLLEELARVRCYKAATAYRSGDYEQTVLIVREIALTNNASLPNGLSDVLARAEELSATSALLTTLSPHQALEADAARFRGLSSLLSEISDTNVGSARGATARDRIRNRLVNCRAKLPADRWQAHFRSLAILHWEWGMAASRFDPPLVSESLECFRFANFLWRHLLTDTQFWTNFASGTAVSREEIPVLRDRVEAEIFNSHREQAHKYLTASDAEGCRFHLTCLQGWDRPPNTQLLTPGYVSSSRPAPGFSESQAHALNSRAEAVFEAWVDQVLWRASRLRDDPATPDRLPPGITSDYDAAIKLVDGALDAVPDHHRLCMFLAAQHADYAYALVGAEQRQEALERLRPAIPIVRRVANERFRGKRVTGPDGDLIRRVFDYAWKLETDEKLRIPLLREHLHWSESDADARRQLRLAEASVACAASDYDTAIDCLQKVDGDPQASEWLLQLLNERAIKNLRLGDEEIGYGQGDSVVHAKLSSVDWNQLLASARDKYKRAEGDWAAVVAVQPSRTDSLDLLRIVRARLRWLKTRC